MQALDPLLLLHLAMLLYGPIMQLGCQQRVTGQVMVNLKPALRPNSFYKLGLRSIRALLLGIHFKRAPDFWKCPSWYVPNCNLEFTVASFELAIVCIGSQSLPAVASMSCEPKGHGHGSNPAPQSMYNTSLLGYL